LKKILITGSEGYIGKHLIKLLSNEYDITTLDINDTNDSVDIRTVENKLQYGERFDTVIHLAALVQVNESVNEPLAYYDTNINGTINILKTINFKNFIFASTGVASQPTNPYAFSKRVAEDIIDEYCTKNSKDFTIFRFYNVIGSDGFPPTNPDGLFYSLIKAETTGSFTIFGNDWNTPDGTCVRDYVHVMEICQALRDAIEDPSGKIENLGHGKGSSVKEIVELYQKVNGAQFLVVMGDRREGDLEKSVLDDISPYMKQLYTMEELCKRTIGL